MNSWVLIVCVGVLWGGMCEKTFRIEYPTEEACISRMKEVNSKLRDGYSRCEKIKKVDKLNE